MPSKTRHVFYKKDYFLLFYYLLDSQKGPTKQTKHTQFLFWHLQNVLLSTHPFMQRSNFLSRLPRSIQILRKMEYTQNGRSKIADRVLVGLL